MLAIAYDDVVVQIIPYASVVTQKSVVSKQEKYHERIGFKSKRSSIASRTLIGGRVPQHWNIFHKPIFSISPYFP